MQIISLSFWIYILTIFFALLIAVVIRGLAAAIEALGLDRGEEDADLSVPTANTAKEEEALAVAIVVAHAKRQ